MNIEELEKRIDSFYLEGRKKIPYSQDVFEYEVLPPHLIMTEIETNNFAADDRVYQQIVNLRLELTSDTRNKNLEKRIEKEILHDIVWNREVTYIPYEKVWNTSYFFEI